MPPVKLVTAFALLCLAAPAYAQSLPAKDAAERTGPPPQPTYDMTTPLVDETGQPIRDTSPNQDGSVCWINLSQPSPSGPVPTADYTPCPIMTIGKFLARTLGGKMKDDENISFEEEITRGDLARRLRVAKTVTFTDGERNLLRKMVQRWTPAVAIQAKDILWPYEQVQSAK
jgi:hypothetical protein